MKDNIFKKITRTILISFLFFSTALVLLTAEEDIHSIWLIIPYLIGIIIIACVGFCFFAGIVGLMAFGLIKFLNWTFNTEYFG